MTGMVLRETVQTGDVLTLSLYGLFFCDLFTKYSLSKLCCYCVGSAICDPESCFDKNGAIVSKGYLRRFIDRFPANVISR